MIGPALYFAPGASPAITLHTFLPPESNLVVAANGQPLVSLVGSQLGWQDVELRNQGETLVLVSHVALVRPIGTATMKE